MSDVSATGPAGLVNLASTLDFELLEREAWVEPDPARQASLVSEVRVSVRPLRRILQQIVVGMEDQPGSRRGRRLDRAVLRRLPIGRRLDILVGERRVPGSDAYLGLLIDRSGSMDGRGIELARRFGALVAEAARDIPGLDGDISAFDDQTFYRLGGFTDHRIAALEADGCNNDAGALLRAAQLALRSERERRVIVVVSDGLPTDCSVAALRNLVSALRRAHGLVLAQVAVAPLEHELFPHHLDVSGLSMERAVREFAVLLARLTRAWR